MVTNRTWDPYVESYGLGAEGFPDEQGASKYAKAYTALALAGTVWTALSIAFVMVAPHRSKAHLVLTVPGVLMAFASAILFSLCFANQVEVFKAGAYEVAIFFGTGAFLLFAWTACVVLLTPLTTMVTGASLLAGPAFAISVVLLVFYPAGLLMLTLCSHCDCEPETQNKPETQSNPGLQNDTQTRNDYYSPRRTHPHYDNSYDPHNIHHDNFDGY